MPKIANTYHAWRGDAPGAPLLGSPNPSSAQASSEKHADVGIGAPRYEDVPGFCKSATLDDIRTHAHILRTTSLRKIVDLPACMLMIGMRE